MSKILNLTGLLILFPTMTWAVTVKPFNLSCMIKVPVTVDNCAIKTSAENVEVSPEILKKIKFNQDGLAEIHVKALGCYWINRRGKARKTHCFDNGSDYFVEGLTRYVAANGKFGFMNKSLDIAIPPKFDFVFPFQGGRAQFCQGCKNEQQNEHSSMVGGTWGFIDKKGKIIVPAIITDPALDTKGSKDKILVEGISMLYKKYGSNLNDVSLTPSEFRCDPMISGKISCSTFYEGCASTSDGGRCCSNITITLTEDEKKYSIFEIHALSLKEACTDG